MVTERVPAIELRARIHAALGDPHRLAIVESLRDRDAAPVELARELDLPSNLLAHHLNLLEDAGLIDRTPSYGDARRRYVRLRPEPLDGLVAIEPLPARSVLFVCTRHSARSQLAAALWGRHSPVPAASAGTQPAPAVHAMAVSAAAERGLDLSHATPRSIGEVPAEPDLVVSVCDRAHETAVAGRWRLHWSTADPVAAGRRAAFLRTIDELEPRIVRLAARVAAA